MNDTTFVYCTSDPELVALYRQTVADRSALAGRTAADLQTLGAGPGIYGHRGGHGFPDEVTAIEQAAAHLPAGWAAAGRGLLRPIAGPAGETARRWLAEHRPPDPRHVLVGHGLPRQVWVPDPDEPDDPDSYRIVQVELAEHDGILWARYPAEPGGRGDFYDQPCTWARREAGDHPAAAAAGTEANR